MTKDAKSYESVNHPKHYNMGSIEVVDAIEDWKLAFLTGSAVKYVARAGKKPNVPFEEDIRKAIWCLKRELRKHKGRARED
jgi:hypothetical protein